MRKMKKINGYLVVKFNARELREYEGTARGRSPRSRRSSSPMCATSFVDTAARR